MNRKTEKCIQFFLLSIVKKNSILSVLYKKCEKTIITCVKSKSTKQRFSVLLFQYWDFKPRRDTEE